MVLPSANFVKLLTRLACGALTQQSIQRAPGAVQLFFVGSGLSMLFTAGVVPASTDRRLYNAYPLDSPVNAGHGVMALGLALELALCCAWTFSVLHPSRPDKKTAP